MLTENPSSAYGVRATSQCQVQYNSHNSFGQERSPVDLSRLMITDTSGLMAKTHATAMASQGKIENNRYQSIGADSQD